MSSPAFALDLAQIPAPVASVGSQTTITPDERDSFCASSDCQSLLRSPSPSSTSTDLSPFEKDHPNGPDRGVFEDAWQAVGRWLRRASSEAADDLDGMYGRYGNAFMPIMSLRRARSERRD